jgi:iron complex outermembrane recepter protein
VRRLKQECSLSRVALLAIFAVSNGAFGQAAAPGAGGEVRPVDDKLEEIIVSASKTGPTRLQDTPMAVTAFDADQLAKSGVSDIKDLVEFAPGLNIAQAQVNAQISIRGIGSSNIYAGSDPDVTMQIDGVYIARPAAQFADFVDIDRIEVLRGPQGTLYGRNAVGGTINVISRTPGDEFQAQESLTVGNYGTVQEQAYVSGPLIPDKLQASFSINYLRHDAYIENVVPGGHDIDNGNEGGFRGQLRYEPTDSVVLTTRFDLSLLGESFPSYTTTLAPVPGAPLQNSVVGDYRKVAINTPQYSDNKTGGVSEDIRWAIDSHLDFTSITAARFSNYNLTKDNDGTELNTSAGVQVDNEKSGQQEFDLNARYDAFEAVGGLFLFAEHDPSQFQTITPTSVAVYLPTTNTQSAAIFAQGTYHVTPELGLTAGLRYTDEEKTGSWDYNKYAVPEGTVAGSFEPASNEQHYHATTPKFGIDWKAMPNVLLYVSATEGYKSGGMNYVATSVSTETFAPEKIWSYELGAKTDWFERRLRFNLSAFKYDYSNLQVQALLQPGVTTITNAATADVKGIEVELTAKPIPSLTLAADWSLLDARYSDFPRASVPAPAKSFLTGSPLYDAALGTYNAAGNYLNNAPPDSVALSAEYSHSAAGGASVFIRGESYWQDKVYFDPTNVSIYTQDAYWLFNASLGWVSSDGLWHTELFGKNLLNKQYLTVISAVATAGGAPGPPRTFGVRLTRSW